MDCGIFIPEPGIVPMSPAVEAWSPNLWTTRKFPRTESLSSHCCVTLAKLLVRVAVRLPRGSSDPHFPGFTLLCNHCLDVDRTWWPVSQEQYCNEKWLSVTSKIKLQKTGAFILPALVLVFPHCSLWWKPLSCLWVGPWRSPVVKGWRWPLANSLWRTESFQQPGEWAWKWILNFRWQNSLSHWHLNCILVKKT